MAERTRIGLIFDYDESWIAGSYYLMNIIHALNTLEDDVKPHITVFARSIEDFNKIKKETGYSYLSYYPYPIRPKYAFLERVINKISRTLLKKNLITKKVIPPYVQFVYPHQHPAFDIYGVKKVNWIPDFQEAFMPHFFSEKDLMKRKKYQEEVLCKGDWVVFSSNDAKSHYLQLYPYAKTKIFVLPFAVTHPDFSDQQIYDIRMKYNIPEKYFFAPNQFWQHKNHIVVLNALKILKEKGKKDIVVVFSGKEYDYRNILYVQELKDFVKKNQLEENVYFLGFLPRKEQLCIMQNAIAVIQPSLFEGWSTVVEDAKALGKHIVLSDIPVHREQTQEIQNHVSFFNSHDPYQLSMILETLKTDVPSSYHINYKKNINSFGRRFLELVEYSKSDVN
ncbi:MAG: glycosyltransferase family 1 protein [Nitrososphaeria archaeon]